MSRRLSPRSPRARAAAKKPRRFLLIGLAVLATVATLAAYSRTDHLVRSMKEEQQLLRGGAKPSVQQTHPTDQLLDEEEEATLPEEEEESSPATEVELDANDDDDSTGQENEFLPEELVSALREKELQEAEAELHETNNNKTITEETKTNMKGDATVEQDDAKKLKSSSSAWTEPRITKSSTVILVLSARSHVELRQTIRETWGSGHDNVYFVIGQYCPINKPHRKHELTCEDYPKKDDNSNSKHDEWYQKRMKMEDDVLREEQDHYQDMLWTPSPESYRGLPHKVKEGYAWIVRNTMAKWIVKSDDDTVVRVASLSKYLEQFDATKPTVIGKIEEAGYVHKDGKWKEEKYTKSRKYPPFPLGSCGHAVSRPVAEYIAANKDSLVEYQGEDTSVGIWIDESPLEVEWMHSKSFENNGKCDDPNLFVIGHDLTVDRVRACYAVGDEVQAVAR